MKETTARNEDPIDAELRRLQEELEQLRRRGAWLMRRSRTLRTCRRPAPPHKRASS